MEDADLAGVQCQLIQVAPLKRGRFYRGTTRILTGHLEARLQYYNSTVNIF